jgi:tetratricopeptide (TPR) repeat protein
MLPVVAFLFLSLGVSATAAEALADKRCSVKSLEADPAVTIDGCTAVLQQDNLSDAVRGEALKLRGRALQRSQRVDEAIIDLEQALELTPTDADVHVRRGWAAYEKRDLERVFALASRAIELKPDFADAYDLLGSVLGHPAVRQYEESMVAFNEAIRLDPRHPLYRLHRSESFRATGRGLQALADLEVIRRMPAASTTSPGSVRTWSKRTSYRVAANIEYAELLKQLGRIEDARKAYDEAVKADPGALTFALRPNFLLGRSAPWETIQADLDRALADDPDYWLSLDVQGRVFYYTKRYAVAVDQFTRSIAQYPVHGELRWWKAMALRELGRIEEATVEAVTAFEVNPAFMFRKSDTLRKHGYLPKIADNVDPRPAHYDAARACMLDDRCW